MNKPFILEIKNNNMPTGEKLIITGGIFKKTGKYEEIIAMEVVAHNSISQNKLIKFIKNEKIKTFERDEKKERKKSFLAVTDMLEKVAKKETKFPKGFEKQLWIHSFATDKSVSIETIYFIVPETNEQEEIKVLKENFKKKVLKKLPLPIKEEWFDFFWEEIEEDFEKLETFGNFKYSGYALNLSLEKLQKAVTSIQSKIEWQENFKRIPKYKPLLQIMNIDLFNFKEWQKFFKEKKEKIEELPSEVQEDVIRAWELLGNEKAEWIIKNHDFIHGVQWNSAQVAIRLLKDKNKKLQALKYFREGFDYFYNQAIIEEKLQKQLFFKFVNLYEEITKEQLQNMKAKNYNAIVKFLENFTYKDIEEEAKEIAKECARCGVGENEFKDYQEWWLDNIENIKTSPREYPTIAGKIKNYNWVMADMSDPKAWVAGLDTYCCQHFHNVGGACVEYAILHPEKSGIFMVQNKTTIAQSFMWLSDFRNINGKEGRIMVLDNIEVAGNELREGIIQAYKDFFEKLEKYASFFKIKGIVIGTGYSDVDIEEAFSGKKINKNHKMYAQIPHDLGYSDAHTQILVKTFEW